MYLHNYGKLVSFLQLMFYSVHLLEGEDWGGMEVLLSSMVATSHVAIEHLKCG